jgi:hypothetical protein
MIGGFHKIPEALKALIAGQTFSESITIERRTHVYPESNKSPVLKCFVAPINATITPGTRAGQGTDWLIGVYVMEQVNAASHAERQTREDVLMDVTDEILEFVGGLKSLDVDGTEYPIRLVDTEPRVPTEPTTYQQSQTFVGSFQVVVVEA